MGLSRATFPRIYQVLQETDTACNLSSSQNFTAYSPTFCIVTAYRTDGMLCQRNALSFASTKKPFLLNLKKPFSRESVVPEKFNCAVSLQVRQLPNKRWIAFS